MILIPCQYAEQFCKDVKNGCLDMLPQKWQLLRATTSGGSLSAFMISLLHVTNGNPLDIMTLELSFTNTPIIINNSIVNSQ